jgi:hypothetical protein
MTQKLLDLSTTIIAFVIGLLAYKRLDRFHRLLFFQVFIYLIMDSYACTLKGDNSWVYNLLMLMETTLLILAAKAYFGRNNMWLIILWCVFLIVFFLDNFYLDKDTKFAFHGAIIEGLVFTFVYTIIIYTHVIKRKNTFLLSPVLWSSIGMVLYFACSVPYICMMFHFQKLDAVLNKLLFNQIIVVLGLGRYLCIAIAFFISNYNFLESNKIQITGD